ncbi:hypothetical protein [Klebsiella oxytoca]|uniref:hypothetical protein n=1 Tax=Klebsiella oxytoca TaxID=571 RepID=UPI003981C8EA
MNNEIERIAQHNDMSVEFVAWFFNEKKSACGEHWFLVLGAMWEGWKGRSIEMDRLAAENVGLKAGVTYFAYSPEYGFDYFKDKQNAIDTAQEEIDAYREDADDGWSEDVQRVSWGVVIQQAQGFDAQGLHTSDSQHTYQTCNYRLVDSVATPATDRIVAEAEARGVEKAIECIVQTITPNHETILKEFAQQLRAGADK